MDTTLVFLCHKPTTNVCPRFLQDWAIMLALVIICVYPSIISALGVQHSGSPPAYPAPSQARAHANPIVGSCPIGSFSKAGTILDVGLQRCGVPWGCHSAVGGSTAPVVASRASTHLERCKQMKIRVRIRHVTPVYTILSDMCTQVPHHVRLSSHQYDKRSSDGQSIRHLNEDMTPRGAACGHINLRRDVCSPDISAQRWRECSIRILRTHL